MIYRDLDRQSLRLQNRQSIAYCINMYGKIPQNEKGIMVA